MAEYSLATQRRLAMARQLLLRADQLHQQTVEAANSFAAAEAAQSDAAQADTEVGVAPSQSVSARHVRESAKARARIDAHQLSAAALAEENRAIARRVASTRYKLAVARGERPRPHPTDHHRPNAHQTVQPAGSASTAPGAAPQGAPEAAPGAITPATDAEQGERPNMDDALRELTTLRSKLLRAQTDVTRLRGREIAMMGVTTALMPRRRLNSRESSEKDAAPRTSTSQRVDALK